MRLADRQARQAPGATRRLSGALGVAARFSLAAALTLGAAGLLYERLPDQLGVRTDIVGYPIHSNFNVLRYLHVFTLVTVFVPVALLVAYELVTRLFARVAGHPPGRKPDPPVLAPEPAEQELAAHKRAAVSLARSLLVGFVFGLEAAYATGAAAAEFWPLVGGVGLGYTAALAIFTGALQSARGSRRSFGDRQAAINALVAPLAVAGLVGVSGATRVVIVSTGSVVHYPWLPVWPAAAVAGGLVAWAAVRLAAARPGGAGRVERRVVLFVTVPVALYLALAGMANAVGPLDLFHEGEFLAGAQLSLQGRFPWRDVYLIHGPFQDILYALPGLKLFDHSRWGAHAGLGLLMFPLPAITLYFLHARLYRSSWVFLAMTPALPMIPHLGVRFSLYPLSLLLVVVLLEKGRPAWGVLLGALLAVQGILTPETVPLAPAAVAVLALFDLYYRRPGEPLALRFRRTISCTAGGVVAGILWAAYLATRGALDDFAAYFVNFGPGHHLTGGIPVQPTGAFFAFAAVAPVAAMLATFLFFAVQIRRSRALRAADWAMGVVALFLVYYYRKFLSRADNHVFQVLAIALPLVTYVSYRAVTALDAGLRRMRSGDWLGRLVTGHPVSLVLLVVVLAVFPASETQLVRGMPAHFLGVAEEPPQIERLGYTAPGAVDRELIGDLGKVLAATAPSGRIFDFTNGPALFHFLLGYEPSTRYYHVSMAIRERTQRDLLAELEAAPPEVVVYDSTKHGLPGWDQVPNMVRHYEVSGWLLDHYRPFAGLHGYVLMLRNDLRLPPDWASGLGLTQPPVTDDLSFRGSVCDWRHAPNFLEVERGPQGVPVPLSFRRVQGRAGLLEIDVPGDAAAFEWLEIQAAGPLTAGSFALFDREGGERAITFVSLDGAARPFRVRVGSCAQWHGYREPRLYLQLDPPQDLAGIRLLR